MTRFILLALCNYYNHSQALSPLLIGPIFEGINPTLSLNSSLYQVSLTQQQAQTSELHLLTIGFNRELENGESIAFNIVQSIQRDNFTTTIVGSSIELRTIVSIAVVGVIIYFAVRRDKWTSAKTKVSTGMKSFTRSFAKKV